MAGISVRMLHHYDKIGLLVPESVNSAGYRFYSNGDIEKLQQILFFKELDFSLSEIKDILLEPGFDKKKALISHRELLTKKRQRLEKIIGTVDRTLEKYERKIDMNNREMLGAFDMGAIEKHKKKYAEEAFGKYGHTDAYKESMEKTSKYTEKEWADIMGKWNAIYQNLAQLMDKQPSDPQVQKLVEQNRQLITKYFYNCTLDIFRGLAKMYVSDEGFTKNIDKNKKGLAAFLNDAIAIYCDNRQK